MENGKMHYNIGVIVFNTIQEYLISGFGGNALGQTGLTMMSHFLFHFMMVMASWTSLTGFSTGLTSTLLWIHDTMVVLIGWLSLGMPFLLLSWFCRYLNLKRICHLAQMIEYFFLFCFNRNWFSRKMLYLTFFQAFSTTPMKQWEEQP